MEAREEMRFKATHDALTSLCNRGMIQELLEREVQRVRRETHHSCVSVILGDVDHFKNVNDAYGHAAADAVLREIRRRLLASVRSYDAVGRYGGEEFLIVLSGWDSDCATMRAEQIRRTIEGWPVVTNKGDISVTISLGVVICTAWENPGGEGLIRQADAAFYPCEEGGKESRGAGYTRRDESLERSLGSPRAAF